MQTFSEYLKKEEGQRLVLQIIVGKLRERGEWGAHGLFARIGKATGFSAAYTGQVFGGKKPLTEKFVTNLAEYLGVKVSTLVNATELILTVKEMTKEVKNKNIVYPEAVVQSAYKKMKACLSNSELTPEEKLARLQEVLSPLFGKLEELGTLDGEQ